MEATKELHFVQICEVHVKYFKVTLVVLKLHANIRASLLLKKWLKLELARAKRQSSKAVEQHFLTCVRARLTMPIYQMSAASTKLMLIKLSKAS